jgi:hypothetical protein
MSFSASSVHTAATMAFVDGIAGMMFLVTPCVSWYVTPCSRFDRSKAQRPVNGLGVSMGLAGTLSMVVQISKQTTGLGFHCYDTD